MSDIVAQILKDRDRRPGQQENEPVGEFLWRLLRESVHFTTKSILNADIKDVFIGHGVHHVRKIRSLEPVQHVLMNDDTNEYITLDSQGFNIFHLDGRMKEQIDPEEPVERLLYAKVAKRYVGWNLGDSYIKMFDPDFELISEAKSPHEISCIVYNEQHNEIVSTGESHIMTWNFRYGAKHLVPKKIAKEGLPLGINFTMLALEDTASRSQKGYAGCETGVAVFNLHDGKLLSYKRDLHVRSITCILFFNPLKYLVTSARDGSIKVWDEEWHLQLVFVGHSAPVMDMAIYPYGPYIITGSMDCSLRMWSLETCDEVDLIETHEPVLGIGTMLKSDFIHSYSSHTVNLWRLRHIHNLFTTAGSKVDKIKVTDHPDMPTRAVCIGRDSTVRVITPSTGAVLTTYLADRKTGKGIQDVTYASADEILFVILKTGEIVKADSSTNPCSPFEMSRRKTYEGKDFLNCICLYEYVVESTMKKDTWAGILKTLTATSISVSGGNLSSNNRTLLIGGRRDGYVAVLDWKTLEVVFKTDAHGMKGVLGIVANPRYDQLITAGLDCGMLYDNVIKIWRVFPFAEEALAPLMSFYCAHTPLHMTVMRTVLCVAFQDPSSATYSIVHYNLNNKNRYDHSPDDDHIDKITGLTCNPRMKVFASSSIDGTIKIWDEDNRLIRAIKLNAEPLSLSFCSQKGDLLVGIGNHVHHISHANYMPKMYMRKMVSMIFPEMPDEKALPYKEPLVRALSPGTNKRLRAAHSSIFKFDRFVDVLTKEETEDITREKKEKDAAFALLAAREEELRKIRDGEFDPSKPHRKGLNKDMMRKRAFKKYWRTMHTVRKRPGIPSEDNFDPDYQTPPKSPEAPWEPELEPSHFFPHPSTAKPLEDGIGPVPIYVGRHNKLLDEEDEGLGSLGETTGPEDDEEEDAMEDGEQVQRRKPGFPIQPTGFIPNSVLVRILWPPDKIQEMEDERYRPPQLSDEQLAQIGSRKMLVGGTITPERIFVWSDEEEDPANKQDTLKTPDKSGFETTPTGTPDPQYQGQRFLDKVGIDITKAPSKREIPDSDGETTPPGTPTPRAPTPKAEKDDKSNDMRKKVTKYAPREEAKPPTPKQRTPTPPPPPTPSPPRPPTPLPKFITQFRGQPWFEEYFPNANNKTFPKPWTVTAFVTMLMRLIKIADYQTKTPLLHAIMQLHCQEPLNNLRIVVDIVMGVLTKTNPPTSQEEDQKEFIMIALRLLQMMSDYNLETIVIFMVSYIDGDKDVRELVHDIMNAIGLEDQYEFFYKEMDGWDIWSIDEDADRGRELAGMSTKWIEKWTINFKSHLKRAIEQLRKGHITGKIQRKQVLRPTPKPQRLEKSASKSILKKADHDGENIGDAGEPGKKESVKFTPAPPSQPKPLTVTFDVAPETTTIDYVQPMEAINYFVEMETEKYLQRMRMAAEMEAQGNDDVKKNTILVLPKIRRGSGTSIVASQAERTHTVAEIAQFLDREEVSMEEEPDEIQQLRRTPVGEHKTAREMWDELQRPIKKKRKEPERVRKSQPRLVRLGESHTSKCRAHRETTLEAGAELRLPPIPQATRRMDSDGLYSFTNKIDFPMKTFYVNPFPSPIDLYDQLHQPILLTLKSSQKYFIPGQSVVPSEEGFSR